MQKKKDTGFPGKDGNQLIFQLSHTLLYAKQVGVVFAVVKSLIIPTKP